MEKLIIHGKYWIVLFLEIHTIYNNNQKFFIPIQIMIPDNFPFIAPMIRVCLPATNTVINTENKDIDQKTCMIMTNLIKKWDWSTSLNKIIEEIQASFNKAFPIMQVQSEQNPNLNMSSQGEWNNQLESSNYSHNYNQNMHPNIQNINNKSPILNDYSRNLNNNKIQINETYVDEKLNSSKGSSNTVNMNWDQQSNSSDSTNCTTNTNFNQNQNYNKPANNVIFLI
jgi:multidrug efflux pump subunit AcrB